MKHDSLQLCLLYDYYAELLTEKQRTCFDLYYDQDLSLSEIAEQAGISRQGVHDTLARAGELLEFYEQKLGMIRREQRLHQMLDEVESAARALLDRPDPPAQALRILELAEQMKE